MLDLINQEHDLSQETEYLPTLADFNATTKSCPTIESRITTSVIVTVQDETI